MTDLVWCSYIRLSQNRGNDEDKPDRQRTKNNAVLAANGVGPGEYVEYVDDDRSAYREKGRKRPDWTRVLTEIADGRLHRVVATHMDRALRNNKDLEGVIDLAEERPFQLVTADSGTLDLVTSAGRQQARLLVTIASGESERKAERHRDKAAQLRAQGKSTGGARPFGWVSPNGALEPEEAKAVGAAIRAVLDDQATLYSIRSLWTAKGFKTTWGRSWGTNKSVGRLLMRYRNAGVLEHQSEIVLSKDGEPVKAVWPAIPGVTIADVENVRRLLADPVRRTTPGPTRKHLLSGLMKCGKCGSPMRKTVQTRKRTGLQHDYYRCGSGTCYLSVPKADAEEVVNRAIIHEFSFRDPAEFAADPADRDRLHVLRDEKAQVARESAELSALVGQGTWSVASAQAAQAGFQKRVTDIEYELAVIASRIATAEMLMEPAYMPDEKVILLGRAIAVGERWQGLTLDKKRAIIAELFPALEVSAGRGKADVRIGGLRPRSRQEQPAKGHPGATVSPCPRAASGWTDRSPR